MTSHQEYNRNDFMSDKIQEKTYECYLEIIEAEEANVSKFYVSHAEGTSFDLDYQCRIMDRGVTLGYDTFGMEYYTTLKSAPSAQHSGCEKRTLLYILGNDWHKLPASLATYHRFYLCLGQYYKAILFG